MALTDRHENVSRRLRAVDDDVLLVDVWKRANLSPRDRSLVTVAALLAGYRTNERPATQPDRKDRRKTA